jgi:ABC-type antimicrobial peptide transport system permease subunit
VVPTDLTIIIRSALPQGFLEIAVRRAVAQVDKDQPVYDVIPLETSVEKSFRTRRFVVWLITLFAALGTVLAAIGLHAVLSYTILLRRREMGIRMALGATRRDIASLVVQTGLRPVTAGIVAGCLGALALHRYFASQLYSTNLWDPITWTTVLLAITITCAAACALPMWRAAQVEPLTALRDE